MMNLRTRPARIVAAVGAVAAVGTTTFMALAAGTASADEPGRCTQNVNIRKEPNTTSRIVGVCESGKQVKLGAERDGFVQIDELGGWASKDYVKADEPTARDHHSSSSSTSSSHDSDRHDADRSSHSDSGSGSGGSAGGLGGLLG